ncbi:PH domain-containing protein [Microlunatus soli]|uniref:PH domain-containing protein n=1 Tax=Microlunatus soli TaxID=630515 RepID=UPI001560F72E|nr:PH domain-containing protein [Microlunatus soli]
MSEREPGEVEQPWQRLHPRTVLASTAMTFGGVVGAGVPVAIGLLLGGVGIGWIALWVVGGIIVVTGAIAVFEALRVRASRFRLREDRIDLRVSLFASSTRSLPLRRIRAVDINADLAQRRLGLASVRLGTGDQSGSRFELTAIDRTQAEALRTAILGERSAATGDRVGRLATFDPSWLRYAPVSLGTPLIGIAALGAIVQVADWFNAVPRLLGVFNDALGALPIPVRILILLVVAVLVGIVGSLLFFVESWWGYQLDRDPDGTLHLQRGLIVRRSSSYQGARIRGVGLDEPIGYRRVGAAKLHVVAVGLDTTKEDGSKKEDSTTIVPAAPREVAVGVAAAILDADPPTSLQSHPHAAAGRRYRWSLLALIAVLIMAAVPAILWSALRGSADLWWLVAVLALLGIPISWWLCRDNIAGLGHLITPEHVVLRSGSVFRRTNILRRRGLLGWNLRQSPAQRRLGLVTLVATSAASPGSFRLPDVDPSDAHRLLATAGPAWELLWHAARERSSDTTATASETAVVRDITNRSR